MRLKQTKVALCLLGVVCLLELATSQEQGYNPAVASYYDALYSAGTDDEANEYTTTTYQVGQEAYMESAVHLNNPDAAKLDYLSDVITRTAVHLNAKRPEDYSPEIKSKVEHICKKIDCEDSLYPTFNGTCHTGDPRSGSSFTCHSRGNDEYTWEDVALLHVSLTSDDTNLTSLGVDVRSATSMTFNLKGDAEVKLTVKSKTQRIEVILSPDETAFSVLTVNGKEEATFKGQKVNDESYSLYWVDWSGKVSVGEGCECFGTDPFLSGKKLKKPTTGFEGSITKPNGNRADATFPIHKRMWVQTDDVNRVIHLGDYDRNVKDQKSIALDIEGEGVPSVYLLPKSNEEYPRLEVSFGKGNTIIAVVGADGVTSENRTGDPLPPLALSVWLSWAGGNLAIGHGTVVGAKDTTLNYLLKYDSFSEDSILVNYLTLTSKGTVNWGVSLVLPNEPRKTSICGTPLPNAREVSSNVHRVTGETTFSEHLNLLLFQMGQFSDHDYSGTPLTTYKGQPLVCCNGSRELPDTEKMSRFCMPIIVKANDPGGFDEGECLTFTRSATCTECKKDVDRRNRNQMNEVTSAIDLSHVYGNNKEENDHLRQLGDESHLLLLDGWELPKETDDNPACASTVAAQPCRFSGDFRNSETPLLNSMHTIWARLHNLIAGKIAAVVNTTDPKERDRVFFVTRNCLISIYQNIVMNEFLTVWFDNDILKKNGIFDDKNSCKYDPSIDIGIMSDYIMLYRVGHTWIPNLIGPDSPLKDFFFVPSISYKYGGTDGLIKSALATRCPETDGEIEASAQLQLFQTSVNGEVTRSDLGALNIQRTADHGLDSYCEMRRRYNLYVPKSFKDAVKKGLFTEETARNFMKVYKHICDVNGFSGAIAELVAGKSGRIGPLLNAALTEQFRRLKCGDKYYFMFDGMKWTAKQKKEFRKFTMAAVVCLATNISEVNERAFEPPDKKKNKIIKCSKILSKVDSDFKFITDPLKPSAGRSVQREELMKAEKKDELLDELLQALEEMEKK